MEKWKEDIINHIKERHELIVEINTSVNKVLDELKGSFPQSLELAKKGTLVRSLGNISNSKWVISVGGFVIEFDLEDIRSYRSRQNDSGYPVFDEGITIDSAIKELIASRIKSF